MKRIFTIIKIVFWVLVILVIAKYLDERMIPKKYLEVSNITMQKRFYGNIFSAELTNKAMINRYNEVILSIDYYGAKDDFLSSNLVMINYNVPYGTIPVYFDAPLHGTMKSYKVRVVSAQAK